MNLESLHLEFKVIEPFKETKEKIELALMVGVTFPNKQVILSPSTHLLCFFKRCYHYDRSLSLPYFFRAGSDRIPYEITKVRGNCGELFLLIRRLSNRSSDKAWYSTRQRNIRVRLLYVTYADEHILPTYWWWFCLSCIPDVFRNVGVRVFWFAKTCCVSGEREGSQFTRIRISRTWQPIITKDIYTGNAHRVQFIH